MEAAARSMEFALEAEGGFLRAVFVISHVERAFWGDPWAPVRVAVCAAPDSEYAAARALVQRRGRMSPFRVMLRGPAGCSSPDCRCR